MTVGILIAAYFDGMASIIAETLTSKEPRPRVRIDRPCQSQAHGPVSHDGISVFSSNSGKAAQPGASGTLPLLKHSVSAFSTAAVRQTAAASCFSLCRPPHTVTGLPLLIRAVALLWP